MQNKLKGLLREKSATKGEWWRTWSLIKSVKKFENYSQVTVCKDKIVIKVCH